MVMDQNYNQYSGPTSGINVNDQTVPIFNDQTVPIFSDPNRLINANRPNTVPASLNSNLDAQEDQLSKNDSNEDFDFSDAVLKYINHILMEEDVEEKSCMFQESAALQAAEKSFSDILEEKISVPDKNHQVPYLDPCVENPDQYLCPDWNFNPMVNIVSKTTSYSSSSSSNTFVDGLIDSPESTLNIPDTLNDIQPEIQFQKGFEEASKFLPLGGNLIFDLECDNDSSLRKNHNGGLTNLTIKTEKKSPIDESIDFSRGKKNPYQESMDSHDERSKNKQSAIYTEPPLSLDMFDRVLLCSGGKNETDLRKALEEVAKTTSKNDPSKSGKNRSKKQQGGKRNNVVDMRTLLTLCAQAVSADDRRTANDFLKQIREHATPSGDGMQRLAYYVADGLEARLAGSKTDISKSLIVFPSATDILKAYHIYLAICPFRKISNFFANKTIMNVSEKAKILHIVDFGILYGFQWPCFLQRLSKRPGGPPKLRITGIDLPCPGFRPSERVEETGRRLESYAKTFKVPFEFNAIAQKWETIKIEDLKIKKDETLVVNCLYRFRNLLDETVMVNSPRNMVLNLIKKMGPAVFVHGIVNGAYNAPFFLTRFREALFHYSAVFDMLDTNIPREIHDRMILERTIFGREVVNVIACEGAERTERPETYKQWQVRNLRAGFKQQPIDREIISLARERVVSNYHKDFMVDEDRYWLLLGWKGRTVYGLCSWKPAN